MEPSDEPLEIDLEVAAGPDGDRATLHVGGEIDAATVAQLDRALAQALDRTPRLVVDLGGVGFIDSSGLRALVDARNASTAGGGILVLAGASDHLRRVFQLSGLDDVFTFEA